jgi:hypothetical protein
MCQIKLEERKITYKEEKVLLTYEEEKVLFTYEEEEVLFTYEEEEVLPLAVLGWYAAPGGDLVHGLCLVHHVRHCRVVHLGFTHLCSLGRALTQHFRNRKRTGYGTGPDLEPEPEPDPDLGCVTHYIKNEIFSFLLFFFRTFSKL